MIRSSLVGTTDRSVAAGQFEIICLASTVSLQAKSDMIETLVQRQLEVMIASLNHDDTYDWLIDLVYNGVTKSIRQCRSDGFILSEHEKNVCFI